MEYRKKDKIICIIYIIKDYNLVIIIGFIYLGFFFLDFFLKYCYVVCL